MKQVSNSSSSFYNHSKREIFETKTKKELKVLIFQNKEHKTLMYIKSLQCTAYNSSILFVSLFEMNFIYVFLAGPELAT